MPLGAIYPNGCDMSLRDENKEFISYRNRMKWGVYRIFGKTKIYRTSEASISPKAVHLNHTLIL